MNNSKPFVIKASDWLLFIMCIVITAGLTLLCLQVHKHNMIEKSRFSYTLCKDFDSNPTDTAIANDIDLEKRILAKNGGRWNERQLIIYLGFFEQLQDYIDAGSLNERDVFDNFSDDILSAYNNKEINTYIHQLRATYKDSAYYEKFEGIAKRFALQNSLKK